MSILVIYSPSKMDPGWKGRQMATLKIGSGSSSSSSSISGEGDDEAQTEVTLVATHGIAGIHIFMHKEHRG